MRVAFRFFLPFITFCLLSLTAFAQKPSDSTRAAAELLNRGDVRGAITILDKAVEKKKDLLEVYKMRSFLRPLIGDFEGALSDLNNAIEIKSDDGELYERRASSRLHLRQDDSLILKDLDSAIAYGRKIEKIYAFRATVKRQMGDTEGAIADYQTAIGLRPDFAQAHVGLASIYMLNGDEDKAAAIYENFLETADKNRETPKVKGKIVASSVSEFPVSKTKNGAEMVGTTVISGSEMRQMPTSPEEMEKMSDEMTQSKNISLAYTNLALIYERRGDLDKSLATVEESLTIDPDHFYAYQIRGKIRSRKGDLTGALDDLNKAVKMMPQMPHTYLERGIVLLMSGKETQAEADFAKYLQMNPNGKPFYEKRVAEAKQKIKENGNQPTPQK
jgi:tetratricopeptide (TPR) repeat protein